MPLAFCSLISLAVPIFLLQQILGTPCRDQEISHWKDQQDRFFLFFFLLYHYTNQVTFHTQLECWKLFYCNNPQPAPNDASVQGCDWRDSRGLKDQHAPHPYSPHKSAVPQAGTPVQHFKMALLPGQTNPKDILI